MLLDPEHGTRGQVPEVGMAQHVFVQLSTWDAPGLELRHRQDKARLPGSAAVLMCTLVPTLSLLMGPWSVASHAGLCCLHPIPSCGQPGHTLGF